MVGVNRPIGIRIAGNNLYITERNDNKISVKDLTSGATTATDLVTGLNLPLDIELAGTTLYILEGGANKISKVENILGIENALLKNSRKLFPNPAENFIQISNMDIAAPYTIYTVEGLKVMQGILEPNKIINVEALATGVYLLRTEEGTAMKFIKN